MTLPTPPTAVPPCTASEAQAGGQVRFAEGKKRLARGRPCVFRSVVHPHRTGEYVSGALGRETPQPQHLAAPRNGGVVNKAG